MFPIKANDPYINKDGSRSTMGSVIGSGGSSDIPEHTSADAGKVLTVGAEGDLMWASSAPSESRYYKDTLTVNKNITAESEVL